MSQNDESKNMWQETFAHVRPLHALEARRSLALSGDAMSLIVLAQEVDERPRLGWYRFEQGLWTFRCEIDVPEAAKGLGLCASLASDGETLALALVNEDENHFVSIYQLRAETWTLPCTLTSPIALPELPEWEIRRHRFGMDLSLSGDGKYLLVSGETELDVVGEVYLFEHREDTWQLAKIFESPDSSLLFGARVCLSADGKTVAIADLSNGVFVFAREGNEWMSRGALDMSDSGSPQNRSFGSSIALSADGLVLAVGDPGGSTTPNRAQLGCGNVSIYNLDETDPPRRMVLPHHEKAFLFGSTIALSADGETLAVGYSRADPKLHENLTQRVCILRKHEDQWTEEARIEPQPAKKHFGFELCLSTNGTTLAVGHLDGDQQRGLTLYKQRHA